MQVFNKLVVRQAIENRDSFATMSRADNPYYEFNSQTCVANYSRIANVQTAFLEQSRSRHGYMPLCHCTSLMHHFHHYFLDLISEQVSTEYGDSQRLP